MKLYTLVKDNREQSKYYHIPEETDSKDEMYEELWDEIRHPAIPIDLVLSKKTYESFIRRDFYRVLRKGDYFTMDIAKDIVQTVRKLRKTWSQGLGYGIIKSTKPQWRTQAWGTFKERIGIM